jgi:NADPH:quinone reductase-like Zn-dependent oxidoreductase
VDAPEPGVGEVRYKVLAFGLNRADLAYMADQYYNSPAYPSRVGHDAAGIVDAVGEGVTRFKVGDHVSSIAQEDGRYLVNGEVAVTPEGYLALWPAGFDAIGACSVWSSAITAYYVFVELAKVRPGDKVLITAGSSTAGTGAIQMAKLLGAEVIATSRTRDKEPFLRSLGVDHVIASDEGNVAAEIMRFTRGQGVRVVFDMVGGKFVQAYADGLANAGAVYLVGVLDGEMVIPLPMPPLIRTGSSITGFSIFNHHRDEAQRERAKAFISAALERGDFKPVVDRIFPFSETVAAYEHMMSGSQAGKIVVRVNEEADLRV